MRNLQNQLLQLERKLESKTKELERANESHSKLQSTLAEQQLTISQVKQSHGDTKSSLSAELKRLEKLNYDIRQELNNCRMQVRLLYLTFIIFSYLSERHLCKFNNFFACVNKLL